MLHQLTHRVSWVFWNISVIKPDKKANNNNKYLIIYINDVEFVLYLQMLNFFVSRFLTFNKQKKNAEKGNENGEKPIEN